MHFFLATAARARPGDRGAFITSSEWLDTNYGRLVRELLLDGLGGEAIHVLEPTAAPFEDAAVTAAITCFRAGRPPGAVRLRRVGEVGRLGALDGGRPVPAERLREARRWSPLTRAARAVPEDHIELGDLVRVHRGAVTGRNSTWVVRRDETDLPPEVLFPSVTRAREIFEAGGALASTGHLRLVVDLPADLDAFAGAELRRIEGFLARARRDGADRGYIARARRAWWSVGLREPAPILATYMARRPPAFTRNLAGARHINIAHGLYPRVELPEPAIERLLVVAAPHRERARRPHLRRRADQVRAARDGADPGARPLRRGGLSVATTFLAPPRWSAGDLERDIAAAVEAFRLERFQEPLEQYLAHLDECLGTIEELVELTVNLTELRERAPEVAAEARYIEALRFLAGPFISVDDLRVIAQTSLAPTALRADPEAAARVVETVLAGLDRRRFPWVGEGRDPHEDEKSAAALATASLMATERVRTLRRNEARVLQESAVADALRGAGFREVAAPRVIRTLEEAPGPGEFCTERTFGDRKADLVVGLWDRRRMPLECKASNSATNSYKRVNHEAASKAETWLQDFGRSQVVPAAVLSGVFKRANLEDAQARGLTLLWAHRLDDLLAWISRTRGR